jgi:DNA-binding response OmpR family regulator
MAYQLYIVEDEVSLSNILKLYLEKEGYQVKIFENAVSKPSSCP